MSELGAAPLESVLEFSGLPVRYDAKMVDFNVDGDPYHGIAFARGLWPLKRIDVGQSWFRLPAEEQNAALAHEAGHCFAFHLEKRLFALPFCWLKGVQRWARAQEFEADAYAVREGYGDGLLCLVTRYLDFPGNALMPSGRERVTNIKRIMQEDRHAST